MRIIAVLTAVSRIKHITYSVVLSYLNCTNSFFYYFFDGLFSYKLADRKQSIVPYNLRSKFIRNTVFLKLANHALPYRVYISNNTTQRVITFFFSYLNITTKTNGNDFTTEVGVYVLFVFSGLVERARTEFSSLDRNQNVASYETAVYRLSSRDEIWLPDDENCNNGTNVDDCHNNTITTNYKHSGRFRNGQARAIDGDIFERVCRWGGFESSTPLPHPHYSLAFFLYWF